MENNNNTQNNLWVSNDDLCNITHIPTELQTHNKIHRDTTKFCVSASQWRPLVEDIAEYRHNLNDKQKEFTYKFIKSLVGREHISVKQAKVLRDIQSKCNPNYLKKPKYWKK